MPVLRSLMFLLSTCLLGACSSLAPQDPLRVELVGLTPLPAQGLEARFQLSMRVQNPNARSVEFDGLAVDLDLNGRPLISGVSDQRGSVPRFGETLVQLPVSLSALSMARQLWAMAQPGDVHGVPYRLRAKLGGGWFGSRRFSDEGVLQWPPAAVSGDRP